MFIQPGRPASPGPWGGLDYHSVNWCNYNCNTWFRTEAGQLFVYIPRQLHVSCILRGLRFFFSSLLSITVIYPLSKNKMLATPSMVAAGILSGCPDTSLLPTHTPGWRKIWWESLSGQEPKNYPDRAGTQVFSASPLWDLFIMVIGQRGGP